MEKTTDNMTGKLVGLALIVAVVVGGGAYAAGVNHGEGNKKAVESAAMMKQKDEDSAMMKKETEAKADKMKQDEAAAMKKTEEAKMADDAMKKVDGTNN